jgi:hypothetical protein
VRRILLAAITASLCAPAVSHAGVITALTTLILPGTSTGTVGSFGLTPAPNNDNAGAVNPNGFSYTLFINSLGLIEAEFTVQPSAGTTEYRVTQNFVNLSGQPWSTFAFELGFGTGASFVRSGADGLDFDTPDGDPAPTASSFSGLSYQSDLIRWTGGSGALATQFAFSIDVPDNLQTVNPSGLNRFTLRQTPNAAVPEPASLLLLSSGAVGLAIRRRRQPR